MTNSSCPCDYSVGDNKFKKQMGTKVHCNNLCVATCGDVVDEVRKTLPVDPFHICDLLLHAFVINGNCIVVVCVAVNVNDGNKKEEASKKKKSDI